MYSLKSHLCQQWNVLQTLGDTAFAYAISQPRITFALSLHIQILPIFHLLLYPHSSCQHWLVSWFSYFLYSVFLALSNTGRLGSRIVTPLE